MKKNAIRHPKDPKKDVLALLKKRILLFLMTFLFMGAAYTQVQPDNDLEKKTMAVGFTNSTLDNALAIFEKTSGFRLIYPSEPVEKARMVNLPKEERTVASTLQLILKGTNLYFKQTGNTIVLFLQNENPQAKETAKAMTVRGTVINENREPLPGAVVMLKSNNKVNATTDVDGKFILTGISLNETLVISFLGYETYEETIGGRAIVNVTLKPASKLLDEVVVTGYQTLSKERTTGSFSIITSEKLDNKLQPALRSILEGQSAGLVVTKDGKVEIRGVSTFSGVSDPLIVLDGYPLIGDGATLDNINPENIQSITVLKDAVATSIYGARASNGVIVVTTKSSAVSKGSFNVGYRGTYGVTLKPDLSKLNLAGVNDYMDAELELYNNDNMTPYMYYSMNMKQSDYTYLLMAKDYGLMSAAEADSKIEALGNNNALQQMQDRIFRASQTQQHNVSISSGTDINQFSAAFRYLGEYGNLINQKNTRLTVDINDTWKPNKWISLRVLSNINYATANSPRETFMDLTSFQSSSKIYPYSQLYDEAGSQTPWKAVAQSKISKYDTYPGMKSVLYHPAEDLNLAYNNANNLQVRLGGDINVTFFDFLKGSFGGTWTKGASSNRSIYEGESFNMRTAYNDGTSRTNSVKHYIPEGGKIDESRGTMESWVIRTQLNYSQTFDNTRQRVTAMLGSEISRDTYESSFLPTRLGYDPMSATYNSGFNPYDYNNSNAIAGIPGDMLFGSKPSYLGTISYGNNYGVRDNRFVSWYGNASYEFNNKYVVNGSIRLDLTNFFGTAPEFRYKPTWSVGGKYKMAEESFFAGLHSIFDQLDLRGSYGITGNISPENTPFLVLSIGTFDPTMGGVSYGVSSYPNSTLRWEKTQIVDLGVDMALFNERVNLTAEYYHKKSTDLITNDAVDQTRGVSNIYQNVGGVTNQGVEVTLTGKIISNKNFTWNSTLIASYNKSNVDYYNITRAYFTSYMSTNVLVPGYPMGGLWGARFSRINEKGSPLYYNRQGNEVAGGSLTAEDAIYLGTLRPPLDMSWTNSFRYRNLDVSFMFIGSFGNKYRQDSFDGQDYTNRHVGERWKKAGDEANTIYPKLNTMSVDFFYYPYGDMLIGNASYVKLRDFTLSYNLPTKWVNSCSLNNVKIFFQTRNLFCITGKGVDIDPETAQVGYTSGGVTYIKNFTTLSLRPEFYFGLQVNL